MPIIIEIKEEERRFLESLNTDFQEYNENEGQENELTTENIL